MESLHLGSAVYLSIGVLPWTMWIFGVVFGQIIVAPDGGISAIEENVAAKQYAQSGAEVSENMQKAYNEHLDTVQTASDLMRMGRHPLLFF